MTPSEPRIGEEGVSDRLPSPGWPGDTMAGFAPSDERAFP